MQKHPAGSFEKNIKAGRPAGDAPFCRRKRKRQTTFQQKRKNGSHIIDFGKRFQTRLQHLCSISRASLDTLKNGQFANGLVREREREGGMGGKVGFTQTKHLSQSRLCREPCRR